MVDIKLVPIEEFDRVKQASIDKYEKLALIADMCRANALASVKRAGSGHLGSSLSALDITTFLYYSELNTVELGVDHPDRDIYFSSKGHDVPGFYALLFSLKLLAKDKLMSLRRLGGTHGHPDVEIPGIEANSGSLGMGISKGKGMAVAKRLKGQGGRVFVMTGDGELQEGQIFEALQTAAHQGVNNLIVIVDHNKVQTDKRVSEICDLRDLEAKFRSFGWQVARCDGHDFRQLQSVFAGLRSVDDKPKILIADTIKGRGVSFMEHPAALEAGHGLYPWHSGAPNDEAFGAGYQEIIEGVNGRLARLGLGALTLEDVPPETKVDSGVTKEYVANAFGEALLDIAAARQDLVVLDGDLAADCRVRAFELKYPERFIENGIAEQDMVSAAGGLALSGLLPVVNTFANFLAMRANEQIYTNACENTKIIYVCHYSGLIPAGPGNSHQSIRDISVLASLPNVEIIQPGNAAETRMALEYCVNQAEANCVLRLIIGPSPRLIELPKDYRLIPGRGVTLAGGGDAVLFAYGPVMLHEALLAAEKLADTGVGLKVINMPWLNRVDIAWLEREIGPYKSIYVLEDHSLVGGLGDRLLDALTGAGLMDGRRLRKFGVEGHAACGTPPEVLKHHGLDGASLAEGIMTDAKVVR